jgi:hypothetical protein
MRKLAIVLAGIGIGGEQVGRALLRIGVATSRRIDVRLVGARPGPARIPVVAPVTAKDCSTDHR